MTTKWIRAYKVVRMHPNRPDFMSVLGSPIFGPFYYRLRERMSILDAPALLPMAAFSTFGNARDWMMNNGASDYGSLTVLRCLVDAICLSPGKPWVNPPPPPWFGVRWTLPEGTILCKQVIPLGRAKEDRDEQRQDPIRLQRLDEVQPLQTGQ